MVGHRVSAARRISMADLVCAAPRLELLLFGRRGRQARAQPSHSHHKGDDVESAD